MPAGTGLGIGTRHGHRHDSPGGGRVRSSRRDVELPRGDRDGEGDVLGRECFGHNDARDAAGRACGERREGRQMCLAYPGSQDGAVCLHPSEATASQ